MCSTRENDVPEIVYRELGIGDVSAIRAIDRSERIQAMYTFEAGALKVHPVSFVSHGFDPELLEAIIERQRTLIAGGGIIFGAFAGSTLVGVASVENRIRGSRYSYAKLDILHVSDGYRKRGIASELLRSCKEAAQRFGADLLYISSTETQNTVDFYLHRGARLVRELDAELWEMEPEDIHLEMDVS